MKYSRMALRSRLLAAFTLFLLAAAVGRAEEPFKGFFTNDAFAVTCQLNLYECAIPVPGLEEELCYGYLQGRLNGTWVILKVKEISDDEALVRAANDKGSEAQDIRITPTAEGVALKQVDGTNMKGIEAKKYVKLPKPFLIERMK